MSTPWKTLSWVGLAAVSVQKFVYAFTLLAGIQLIGNFDLVGWLR